MKDKPIVIYITLLAGLVSCIVCILNNAGLLNTLLYTLITLVVFVFIGLIANKIISEINHEVEEKDLAEKRRLEDEQREKERLEEEEAEARRAAAEAEKRAAEEEEALRAAEEEEKKNNSKHNRLF